MSLRRTIGSRIAAAAGLEVIPPGEFDVVRRDYYSPLPDVSALPPDHFERPGRMSGVQIDLDAQLGFIESGLGAYIREFSPPLSDPGSEGRYFTNNGMYEAVDGEVAYAMVRHLRPARVVELGSGFSTLALAAAAAANARDGTATELVTFDPYPRGIFQEGLSGLKALHTVKAQDVPLSEFEALEARDVVFVDTSHTVKAGGDVNSIVLDVLPILAPGVVVHFHDIFLPYEYHRGWLENERYWAEQYLLQAFLSMNPSYEVVLACHCLLRERRDSLMRLVPSLLDHQPTGFWITRRS